MRDRDAPQAARFAPIKSSSLYSQLKPRPNGPSREQVMANQRARMCGAMMQAIATRGYAATSVAEVCRLAGVSKRTFYEQFACKEDCLTVTYRAILERLVPRLADAYRSAGGGLQAGIAVALGAFLEEAEARPQSTRFLVLDLPTVDPIGHALASRLVNTLANGIGGAFGDVPTPSPVAVGIVGGLRGILAIRLHEGHVQELRSVAEEMVKWVALFGCPAAGRLRPAANVSSGSLPRVVCEPDSDSWGLRRALLEFVCEGSYGDVRPEWIAARAGIGLESFYNLFGSRDECFVSAFAALSERLLKTVALSGQISSDWGMATHRRLSALLGYLVAHPLYAETLVRAPGIVGPVGIECNLRLALDIANLLAEGAPTKPSTNVALEGIAGATSQLIGAMVQAHKTHLLGELTNYLTYITLAPFLGGEVAMEVIEKSCMQ